MVRLHSSTQCCIWEDESHSGSWWGAPHFLPTLVECQQWLIILRFHSYTPECRPGFVHLFSRAPGGLFHSGNMHLQLLGDFLERIGWLVLPFIFSVGAAGLVLFCCCGYCVLYLWGVFLFVCVFFLSFFFSFCCAFSRDLLNSVFLTLLLSFSI